jgi:glycosyltransferase involved in cell wall biosynthesis
MARSLYRILVPVGSRRDRFVWIGKVTAQKLREGPGPWLRAVRKGVYQLLPPAWQQRILRWTGQEQFFRRGDVRHAEADAGVERPGLVSLVLPVFNHASMVGAAIDSVLAQTYAPLELIVVDDGSTDGVAGILQRYLDDPRVRVLTQPNQGLPKALSTGFEAAVGEFFTWTSADNVMLPGCIARLVAFLRDRPSAAMVYADYEVIDEDGTPLVGGEFRVMDRTDKQNLAAVRSKRHTHDLNRYEDNFIGPCFLYRGQVGRLLGDYNPELGLEDYDYWMRINRMFTIEHLGTDELLYRYRVHDNTLSARARELRILERARLLMNYERQRAAWLQAPSAVLADESSARWLASCVAAPDSVAPLDAAAVHRAEGKTMVVVDGENLPAAPLYGAPPNVGAVAFFARPEHAHRAHLALRDHAVAAFAADADTAARLAVHTRAVFAGAPGPDALALAVRHVANDTFFRTTRDPARLRRAVPRLLAAAEPLRVLLQVDTFGRGGLERVVEDLAHALPAHGVEVGVLAVDGSPEAARLCAEAGAELVRLAAADAAAYTRVLREGRWHVVSAQASVFGAADAAAAGVPFVQTVHNSYVWFDAAQIEAQRAADPHTAAYACVSAEALAYADLRLQLDVQKMLVLENGIAERPVAVGEPRRRDELRAELGLQPDDFVFLQVASLQPAKAHRIAVRALAALRRHEPLARLVCLGQPMNPVHAALVQGDVRAAGIEDAVVFAGHRPDPGPFYELADAFLLPSYWEGCSLAVWEALRAGLPLVLSDVGAAREQLRHGRGALVQPPFASMLDLDAQNVPGLVGAVQPDFVDRTVQAMSLVMAGERGRIRSPVGLPPIAARTTMAWRYTQLFLWLRRGGPVAGVRELLARAAEVLPERR